MRGSIKNRKYFVFLPLLILICCFSFRAQALTFKGLDGLVVYLAKAPTLGKDAYLVKIEGVDNDWADKVFKVEKESSADGARYILSYEIELSSGIQQKNYYLLTPTSGVLYKGSYLDAYQLYLPGYRNEPFIIRLDPDASDNSAELLESYQKVPFSPSP